MVKVAAILNEPFLIDDGAGGYKGYIADLLSELAALTGTTHEIELAPDGRYGSYDNLTGRFNGVMGMVQRNDVEFAAADLTRNELRGRVVDFTEPFMTNPLTVMLSKAESDQCPWIGVFSWQLWLVILAAFIVTSFCHWLFARISPKESENVKSRRFGCFMDSAWFLFASFFRGTDYSPRTVSSRVITAAWWIFALSVVVIYARNLNTTDLGVKQYESLEEMVADPESEFGCVAGGSTYQMLQSTNNRLYQKIFQKINAENGHLHKRVKDATGDLLDGGEDGRFGFVIEGASADKIMGDNCQLYTIGRLGQANYGLAFKKNSRYYNNYNTALRQLRVDGVLARLRRKWFKKGPCHSKPDSDKTTAQKAYDSMCEPCLLLIVLILVAFIVSLLELLNFARKEKSSGKKPGKVFTEELKEAFIGWIPKKKKSEKKKDNKKKNKDDDDEKDEKEPLKEPEA